MSDPMRDHYDHEMNVDYDSWIMTFPTISAYEAREAVDALLWSGRITPAARTYLKIRVARIAAASNAGHRLYRLVESYR